MTTCAFSKQTISAASFSPETTPSLVSPQSTDHSTSACKKPRKNRSAYTLFALDIKPKLKANSNLKMSCVDLQTTISQLWKDLPAEERKKYQDQANEEKLHYMLKLKKFYENASPETLEEATKPKPKRPYSAYCYFVKEIRHIIKIPDAKFKMQEILKQASERWRMLTEEEKAVYHEKAKQARENYQSEAVDPNDALIEESLDAAEFAFEPQETKKKVSKKESKTPSTNKKRGLHFSKDIREKMEKLDRQSPVKKVKPDFFAETHSNLGMFTPKVQSAAIKLETFIGKAPCLEEPSKTEIKQESMEAELLKPIPIKAQPNQFWPNMGMPQMWNLEMPPVNRNVNLMGELSLAMGFEQAKRQLMGQLLMRQIGQMTLQQNISSLLGNNQVEVKAESL